LRARLLPIAESEWNISPSRGIAWNSLEGLIGIAAGVVAGSVSLVGFGIDSLIEVTSGARLVWRMSVDADAERRERNERLSLRIVGVCFLALARIIHIFEDNKSLLCYKHVD